MSRRTLRTRRERRRRRRQACRALQFWLVAAVMFLPLLIVHPFRRQA